MNRKTRFLSAALMLLIGNTSYAGLVTYNYTGTIESGTGIFSGASTIVSGTITWDDLLLDSNPSGRNDYYANNDPIGNQPYTSSYTATMNVGGNSYSESATNPTILDAFVSLRDHGDVDSFRYTMIRNGASEDRFRLAAVDEVDGSLTPDGIATGTNNLTGNMSDTLDIIDNIDLSLFNSNVAASWWIEWDDVSNTRLGRLDFTITSLTRAVPEPGTLTLLLLGLAGISTRRRVSRTTA